MYWRKMSIGSWPTRIVRRLAAALTRPELVRASIRASRAASISSRSTVSSTSRSPSGVPASNSRPEKIAWRASRSPTKRAQPQVGRAGDDPLLAGGEEQARAALGDHVVHHVQQLAGAADRVGLHGCEPQLLGGVLGLVRAVLGPVRPR